MNVAPSEAMFIATDQAEAHAAAKVREAFEKAQRTLESMCGRLWRREYQKTRTMKRGILPVSRAPNR